MYKRHVEPRWQCSASWHDDHNCLGAGSKVAWGAADQEERLRHGNQRSGVQQGTVALARHVMARFAVRGMVVRDHALQGWQGWLTGNSTVHSHDLMNDVRAGAMQGRDQLHPTPFGGREVL